MRLVRSSTSSSKRNPTARLPDKCSAKRAGGSCWMRSGADKRCPGQRFPPPASPHGELLTALVGAPRLHTRPAFDLSPSSAAFVDDTG